MLFTFVVKTEKMLCILFSHKSHYYFLLGAKRLLKNVILKENFDKPNFLTGYLWKYKQFVKAEISKVSKICSNIEKNEISADMCLR